MKSSPLGRATRKYGVCTNDDELKTRLVDLELQLANEKCSNENQAKELAKKINSILE